MKNLGLTGWLRACWTSRTLVAVVLVASFATGCGSPTAPTPPPPPPPIPTPDPNPPTLTCPAAATASTTSPSGTTVTFAAPTVAAGKEPVTVACTPASGATFPLGATTVTCTGTDALSRANSCSFTVTVSRTPELTMTKFLAFGDSITAGEVTFPIAGVSAQGFPNSILRLVPSAAYPTVLQGLMGARYTSQVSAITVINEGLGGEMARDAVALMRLAQALSTHRPNALLLMHGYNDIGDPSALSTTVSAVGMMAAEGRHRGARVFIANLAPSRTSGSRARPSSSVTGFNDRLMAVIRGEGATLVDVYGALLPAVDTYIGIDGLHPNEAGYRKIAETFMAAIQATLEVR
ncbi:MAG: GDSL-type esterase/lipase family protein [Acidobacteriota bacterium]|nr:GDSL-type esterase/lipase family protein [Acidobacteriota bacterium]